MICGDTSYGRRFGRFYITAKMIETEPEVVQTVFAKCIVVRADFHFYGKRIGYEALCPEFAEITEGAEMPEYEILIQSEGEKPPVITFKKKE